MMEGDDKGTKQPWKAVRCNTEIAQRICVAEYCTETNPAQNSEWKRDYGYQPTEVTLPVQTLIKLPLSI